MRPCLPLFSALLLCPAWASADPIEQHDVICTTANGPRDCGTMRITQFDTRRDNITEEFNQNRWLGGVDIRGFFSSELALDYHYLQAVVIDEADDVRWFNDTSVKLPKEYVDAPPGGSKVQPNSDAGYTFPSPFDYRPWYDQNEFPLFNDRPQSFLLPAKDQPDKKLFVNFETWLVCVIDELYADNGQALDDRYRVAPLLGWVWGYVIVYEDVGVAGTVELVDFTVEKTALKWVEVPSPEWRRALGARFGQHGQDFFRIGLGDCEECVVAEPPVFLMLSAGALALGIRWTRRNRRRL